jgi:hypothetical protein
MLAGNIPFAVKCHYPLNKTKKEREIYLEICVYVFILLEIVQFYTIFPEPRNYPDALLLNYLVIGYCRIFINYVCMRAALHNTLPFLEYGKYTLIFERGTLMFLCQLMKNILYILHILLSPNILYVFTQFIFSDLPLYLCFFIAFIF